MPILQGSLFRKTLLAWAALSVGLLVTVYASLYIKQDIEAEALRRFAFACDQITSRIQDRLGNYALILRGGAALFAASKEVERVEWRAYVEELRASQNVPEAQGIGFAPLIPADRLAAHIARIQGEGFPEYTVNPPGERSIYTPIIFIEPFRDRNLRAFGFDMFSEPVRRAAMEQARDTGEAALSGKVELVQETGTQIQSGTLMYVPVYRNGASVGTIGQRQAALIGWAYSAYRMDDFMAGMLRDWLSQEGKIVRLLIYDGPQAIPANLLYSSQSSNSPDLHSLLYQQRTINFNGHQWLLVFELIGKPSDISFTAAWASLAGGLTLSALLFWLIRSIINTQVNAARIAERLTKEIRYDKEALNESNEKFNLLLNSTAEAIYGIDMDDNCTFCNNSCLRLLGYKHPEELLGKKMHWKIHGKYPDGTLFPLEKCRIFQAIKKGEAMYVDDEVLWRSDGTFFPAEYLSSPQTKNGAIIGAVVSFFDITQRKHAEKELRISTLKYQTLFESSRDALMMVMPPSWRFTGANQATLQLFGASSIAEFCKLGPWEISPERQPDGSLSSEKAQEMIATALREGSHFFEWEHQRLDGQMFTADVLLTRIDTGEKQFLQASVRDITSRKLAEAALAESRDLLQTVIDSAPVGVFWKDRNLRYLGCNRVFATSAGMTDPQDVIGKDDYQMPWSNQAKYYRADDQAAIESGIAKLFYDAPHTNPNGDAIWLRSSKIPLRNHTNEIIGLLGVYENITERKQAEDEIRISEERLNIITSSASDAIIMLDEAGNISFWNQAAERMFGYNRKEVIGRCLHSMLPPLQLREAYFRAFPHFQKTGQGAAIGKTVELAGLRKDGSEFPLELSLAAVQVEDAWQSVGILRDITERKQADETNRKLNEELEIKVQERTRQLLDAQEELVRKEKLAVLGQVAGSVGHELRNPLGVMSNAVYFLQTVLSDADETTLDYLGIIKEEIAASERIVTDLLDSVRIKPPHPETVGIAQLIEQTLNKCTIPPTVAVRLDIPETLPPIRVDALQIHQVFRNLICNAFEAMAEGGALEIRALENADEKDVTVSISDTGIGMTPEQQTKLFQPLFTTKARGIGLGLVVVKNLTQANGGTVEVESEPGKGTTFTVVLPTQLHN